MYLFDGSINCGRGNVHRFEFERTRDVSQNLVPLRGIKNADDTTP